jgi:hypothetical protein
MGRESWSVAMAVILIHPELVRLILRKIESASYPLKGRIGFVTVDGHDQRTVDEHIEEMRKVDLLDAVVKRSHARAGGPIISAEVRHLTDTGWRIIGLVKTDESWKRVLNGLGNGQVTIQELMRVLTRQV